MSLSTRAGWLHPRIRVLLKSVMMHPAKTVLFALCEHTTDTCVVTIQASFDLVMLLNFIYASQLRMQHRYVYHKTCLGRPLFLGETCLDSRLLPSFLMLDKPGRNTTLLRHATFKTILKLIAH